MLKNPDPQFNEESYIRNQMTSKIIPTMRMSEIQEVLDRSKAKTKDLLDQVVKQHHVVFNTPAESLKEKEIDDLLNLCTQTRECMSYSLYIINNLEKPTPDMEEYRDAIHTIFEEVALIVSLAYSHMDPSL